MEPKYDTRFVSVIGHALLIIWEYDDWCLGAVIPGTKSLNIVFFQVELSR